MEAFETYAQGRICLEGGDRFNATGGPYYRLADGSTLRMNDHGPFTFLRYCVDGARAWIEARSPDGHCILDLGPERPSTVVEGLIKRPYRIKPLYERNDDMSSKKKRKPANAAKATEVPSSAPADQTPIEQPTEAAEPKARKKREPKEPAAEAKLSAIDAAAKVLEEAGAAMSTKDTIAAMAEKGYWTSPGGLTPHATLYSAITCEIANKGGASRFAKADRGTFTLKA